MTKLEFISLLEKALSDFPQKEVRDRLSFYSEMIADHMEEGLSEEEAVSSVGSLDEITAALVPTKDRKLKAWEIVLLVLGSPVWLSLAVAAAAVVFALYVSLWAVVVSLWAVFGSLAVCVPGSIAAGIIFAATGNVFLGIAMLGCAAVCAGLSIVLFFTCKAATKGMLMLTKKMVSWIKNCFTKREGVQ